ncbi:hypothetical protein EUX98_g3709 [Antrodiella citrinella]|uniref:Thaumatin-like protein n=1 Tax=Antrodiella citrinella TaxID=2447956 RepID=A0A4S4MVX8_9APHY|nr:hypothetical protein EUX98_g3709 [Antrodiella citrinella]
MPTDSVGVFAVLLRSTIKSGCKQNDTTRRDCDFSSSNPATQCADGGCNGGLVCDPNTGTGVAPATLAEFTLSAAGNQDFYDLSLVDGFNLPVRIDNDQGCAVPQCAVDLGPNCPAPFQGPFNSTGFPLTQKCGQYYTPQICPSSGSAAYDYFKSNCPDAYAYAYDESSESALGICDASLEADYTITFCPAPE